MQILCGTYSINEILLRVSLITANLCWICVSAFVEDKVHFKKNIRKKSFFCRKKWDNLILLYSMEFNPLYGKCLSDFNAAGPRELWPSNRWHLNAEILKWIICYGESLQVYNWPTLLWDKYGKLFHLWSSRNLPWKLFHQGYSN